MQNINVFIKENIGSVANKALSVAPDIPEKKLNNIANSMKVSDIGSVIALVDTTVLGSGKDGFVFTGEKMIYKAAFEKPISVSFENIESAQYVRNVTENDKGKEKVEEYTEIGFEDGSSLRIKKHPECNLEKLADFLNVIASDFDSFEEENQLVALAEMSEELKVAYLKIVINMTFADDGEVDEEEFAQILLLMTRLELSPESRFTLRDYITSLEKLDCIETLIKTIKESCESSHYKPVTISLVKDLFSVFMSVNGGSHENFAFFNDHNHLFHVSEDEVSLIIEALNLDFKMLNDDFTDDALAEGMKELATKAGSVGVPLAAVYLSGSVVGMSAAGLTSGLATLGMGGVLGLSSMATGIGVAVLIGVGAYKGIKHLTGANELDKNKRRELMLNEVIKQTQSTVTYLMDDINYITLKLNDAIINHGMQGEKVKLLLQKVKLLTSAGHVLTQKNEENQNKCFKLKCPAELDHEKLKSLTREATKQNIYSSVMSFYVETEVEVERNEKTELVKVLKLKEGTSNLEMEKLAAVFEAIGYFKAKEVLKGKVSGFFS